MMNKKFFTYKKGYTHSTIFHGDDVYSTALCELINPDFTYIRGLKPEDVNDPETLIYDIGRGEYDHHQLPKESRENGIPYAAFGKLWRDFGWIVISDYEDITDWETISEIWRKIDEEFVSSIDAVDNGVEGSSNNFSDHISRLNPRWNDPNPDSDKSFKRAVAFAKDTLIVAIEATIASVKAKEIIEDALSNITMQKIVVLDKYVPWQSVLVPSEAEFVIYPSLRGGYSLQVIPKSFETREAKRNIPEKYWGAEKDSLPAGCTFVHNTGFISNWNSVKEAVEFINSIL